MKSKTLRRVRLAIARNVNHNHSNAKFWRDTQRYWRDTPRCEAWTEERCSRLASEAGRAARYFEDGAIGPWPNIDMSGE